MKTKLFFFLLGALILIVTNSLLLHVEGLIFNGPIDYTDLGWLYVVFMFTLILFQWVFILVMIIYHTIRTKVGSNNLAINWLIGFAVCLPPYLFFCAADGWDTFLVRAAIINSAVFGLVVNWLYKKMISKQVSRQAVKP